MEWKEWKKIYEEILRDFGYSKKKDEESAKIAKKLSLNRKVDENYLKNIIEGKIVTICGAAISEKDIEKIEGVIISADETTSFLIRKGIFPDIITTDLDGEVEDILKTNEKGSLVIVHAHGDNIGLLKKYLGKFKGDIMITTQSKPFDAIYNFGGFTDGDRAYCIAKHFKAKKINLVGFDFSNPIKKEGKNLEIKRKKLEWAKKIMDTCIQ
ncbi:MAG: 6-hydroxymethylpterin diphosphokinase MptE-like protein [Candidatus Thermoplasmatota archaeon]